MLESLFTNVFGRPKNKSGGSRGGSQQDPSGSAQLTGPFSSQSAPQMPQMPQPPNLPYPVAPYPSIPNQSNYYPSLPFGQPFATPPAPIHPYTNTYPANTVARQVSPLDSVPFEARLALHNSTNLVSLDQLFKEIKKAADVVDRADAYLRSKDSDYDFNIELNLIHH